MDLVASRELNLRQSESNTKTKSKAPPSSPARADATSAMSQALPRIYGYFHPRVGGNRALTEDLTQETMLSAVRSANTPTDIDELMPWLFSIARNKLIDYYRKQDRERRNFGQRIEEDDLGVQPGLPDLDLESLPIRDEVIATLAELNPRFQAAIILRYFDGCDVSTVAQAMFLSESATQSLLARARNAFRATWIARNGESR